MNYTVSVRGSLPPALAQRITQAHAAAVKSGKAEATAPGKGGTGM